MKPKVEKSQVNKYLVHINVQVNELTQKEVDDIQTLVNLYLRTNSVDAAEVTLWEQID